MKFTIDIYKIGPKIVKIFILAADAKMENFHIRMEVANAYHLTITILRIII